MLDAIMEQQQATSVSCQRNLKQNKHLRLFMFAVTEDQSNIEGHRERSRLYREKGIVCPVITNWKP